MEAIEGRVVERTRTAWKPDEFVIEHLCDCGDWEVLSDHYRDREDLPGGDWPAPVVDGVWVVHSLPEAKKNTAPNPRMWAPNPNVAWTPEAEDQNGTINMVNEMLFGGPFTFRTPFSDYMFRTTDPDSNIIMKGISDV